MSKNATTSTPIMPTLSDEVFNTLPESIRLYIRFLEATIQAQQSQIQQLEVKVKDLEARLAKNSSNSSKPPSSDGLKKPPKSLRDKTGKKQGGQQGHTGKTLKQVASPDLIITHTPSSCLGCGACLDSINGSCKERRQVFDILQPKIEVTEHQVEEKKCLGCGKFNRSSFPENVKGPVQYGESVQALSTYFAHQHFIPVDRTAQILEDIFGISISPGTIANIDTKLFQNLAPFESSLKKYLLTSEVLNFDETGMRCEKKLHWIHVASSELATFYTMHPKRGQEAMDAAGILPYFTGIAVHDHWFPYFSYEKSLHGLCNTHHLRELTFIYEQEKEDWAKKMMDFLISTKNEVAKYIEQGSLPQEILPQMEQAYTKIVTEGMEYHAQLTPLPKAKRGRQKQRPGKNLLDRFHEKRDCVLRFMNDFSVPFTNNRGEQDIRMVKLKQKISGCFRTFAGGELFCRVRGYISTARKQGWNIWDALTDAIKGCPRLLQTNPSGVVLA